MSKNEKALESPSMTMVRATIRGIAPYSQSKHYSVPKLQGESADDHYRRTWRNHCHVDKTGTCFIPPSSLKNCFAEAAKFLSLPVPGKGKATYTKHAEAGVLCFTPVSLDVHVDSVQCEALFLPSDGRRGSGKRVMKYLPFFPEWGGVAEFMILDDTILQSTIENKDVTVFEKILRGAGNFIGLGRFRPRNNGYYGRFVVDAFEVVRT